MVVDGRGIGPVLSPYKIRQVLFLRYKAKLILAAQARGLFVAEAEGCLMPDRKSRLGLPFQDGVHMRGSLHYERLATDFVIYDEATGAAVTDPADARWTWLGETWEAIDPELCRWGGRFKDANHFSVTWDGRA